MRFVLLFVLGLSEEEVDGREGEGEKLDEVRGKKRESVAVSCPIVVLTS